jgi:hypothetical protein
MEGAWREPSEQFPKPQKWIEGGVVWTNGHAAIWGPTADVVVSIEPMKEKIIGALHDFANAFIPDRRDITRDALLAWCDDFECQTCKGSLVRTCAECSGTGLKQCRCDCGECSHEAECWCNGGTLPCDECDGFSVGVFLGRPLNRVRLGNLVRCMDCDTIRIGWPEGNETPLLVRGEHRYAILMQVSDGPTHGSAFVMPTLAAVRPRRK